MGQKEREEIRAARDKSFGGGPGIILVATGKIWAGMLTARLGFSVCDLPPEFVAEMLAALKLGRAALPTRNDPDDHNDAVIYTEIAESIKEAKRGPGNNRTDP